MSMLANFRQISPSLLERTKAQPALAEKVMRYRPEGPPPESDTEAFISLLPAHMRKMVESMPAAARADFLTHVEGSLGDMPEILRSQIAAARRPARRSARSKTIDPVDVGAELDIAQAWHGVHFLLCGSAGEAPGPLGAAVLGGTEIGPDHGYGPARYLEPAEVQAVGAALATFTPESLAERFDPEALEQNGIYPGGWTADDERCEWLCDAFVQVQGFYAATAAKGWATLMYVV
jgi:hypothetical protein